MHFYLFYQFNFSSNGSVNKRTLYLSFSSKYITTMLSLFYQERQIATFVYILSHIKKLFSQKNYLIKMHIKGRLCIYINESDFTDVIRKDHQ